MFDQVLENFRKATESTVQFQQQLFRQWSQPWGQMPGFPWPTGMVGMPQVGAGLTDQADTVRRKWAEGVTDTLNKHRETLDTQYRAGIRAIEDAFRLGDAKDPEQARRLAEELWKRCFDCLKTVIETQTRDAQVAAEKWFEAVSTGMTAAKP